jgi:hypothetical protein
MNKIQDTYVDEGDLIDEGEGAHPRPGHPREQLWQEAKDHHKACLFEGAKLLHLFAILQISNLQTRHKASNVMLDDLF